MTAAVADDRLLESHLRKTFDRSGLEYLGATWPDLPCGHCSFARLVDPADVTGWPTGTRSTVANATLPCCHLTVHGCSSPGDRRPWTCVRHVRVRGDAVMEASEADHVEQRFGQLDDLFIAMQYVRVGPPAT